MTDLIKRICISDKDKPPKSTYQITVDDEVTPIYSGRTEADRFGIPEPVPIDTLDFTMRRTPNALDRLDKAIRALKTTDNNENDTQPLKLYAQLWDMARKHIGRVDGQGGAGFRVEGGFYVADLFQFQYTGGKNDPCQANKYHVGNNRFMYNAAMENNKVEITAYRGGEEITVVLRLTDNGRLIFKQKTRRWLAGGGN